MHNFIYLVALHVSEILETFETFSVAVVPVAAAGLVLEALGLLDAELEEGFALADAEALVLP